VDLDRNTFFKILAKIDKKANNFVRRKYKKKLNLKVDMVLLCRGGWGQLRIPFFEVEFKLKEILNELVALL
jgi:hypothetical protein